MSYVKSQIRLQLGATGKGLLAATAVGWGLFVYSVLSTGFEENTIQSENSQLRQQIETVTAERDQLTKANDQKILAGQDLNTVLVRIEAATEELQQLDSLRASVSQAIEQTRLQFTGPSDQPAAMTESPTVSTMSAVRDRKSVV